MGHPDLIERTIRQELPRIRSYCAAICGPERLDEALSAAVLDFRARSATAHGDEELPGLAAKAARSAASARADLRDAHTSAPQPECLTMPELLAARANDELPGEDRVIRQHLSECIICETTFARMRRAEQILFAPAPTPAPVDAAADEPESEEPAVEPEPAEVEPAESPEATAEPPPLESPPAESPAPEPPAPEPRAPEPPTPPPPIVLKRRSGGLLEAVRNLARNAMR